MDMDLNELKTNAVAMQKGLEMWSSAVKAIDIIVANKRFLEVADSKKREYSANVEALANTLKEYADARGDYGREKARLATLKREVVNGVSGMKARLEKELASEMAERRTELNGELNGLREEIEVERDVLTNLLIDIDDTKKELKKIQTSLRGMLG